MVRLRGRVEEKIEVGRWEKRMEKMHEGERRVEHSPYMQNCQMPRHMIHSGQWLDEIEFEGWWKRLR